MNELFHYAHRVGHVFFMRFPPLDAQNDPVGTRLYIHTRTYTGAALRKNEFLTFCKIQKSS